MDTGYDICTLCALTTNRIVYEIKLWRKYEVAQSYETGYEVLKLKNS